MCVYYYLHRGGGGIFLEINATDFHCTRIQSLTMKILTARLQRTRECPSYVCVSL